MLGCLVDLSAPLPKGETPRLTKRQQKALDFIKSKPGCKGIQVAKHLGIDEGGFRSRYVPTLKKVGVTNHGEGYYPPPEST